MALTIPGHKLEFIEKFYRREKEGKSLTTTSTSSTHQVPETQVTLSHIKP